MLKLFYLFIRLCVKDIDSGRHSIRVAFRMFNYALTISEVANISVLKAFFYGLFHDIGKIGIPNSILKKKGKLTPEEFTVIKSHTSNEYALLAEKYFPGICDHHETMNGKGYYGKSGNELNVYAKVLAIADVYDALYHKRTYKEAIKHHDVIIIMNEMLANGKFDKLYYKKVMEVA